VTFLTFESGSRTDLTLHCDICWEVALERSDADMIVTRDDARLSDSELQELGAYPLMKEDIRKSLHTRSLIVKSF
jgi:hypothetical protein